VDSGQGKVGLGGDKSVGLEADKDPDFLPIREKVGLGMDRTMQKGRLEVGKREQKSGK
jgi:hypothetical protein